ncbi:hypothetical protein JTB14_037404 [Gonioctena quinquepunctata]|nr:hypothetical protein JTB14_037404 [Gonioctena quinquepunctata]
MVQLSIVGINLGKNKTSTDPVDDYVQGIKKFGAVADYLVINISSPNTPGLRKMQDKDNLRKLLRALVQTRNDLPLSEKPHLLLKLAPDLSMQEKEDIADVLRKKECKVDGLIVSNTTIERPHSLHSDHKQETGGLSGTPLKNVSTEMIRDMRRLTNGMPIIGVGGISTGQDAYEKIKAGASLVQLYTALIYEGPPVVTKTIRKSHWISLGNGEPGTYQLAAVQEDIDNISRDFRRTFDDKISEVRYTLSRKYDILAEGMTVSEQKVPDPHSKDRPVLAVPPFWEPTHEIEI